jgi:aspartate/methionine/tyrosine aminotransferase
MKKVIADLTWGQSVCVRDAFTETLSGAPVIFGLKELSEMGYPKHEGNEELIEITRKVIERQTGNNYKHILLTNGATGGVTIALRTYRQMGKDAVFTRTPPYFAIYPAMIEAAGFTKHVTEGGFRPQGDNPVAVIDSPSNPQGLFLHGRVFSDPVIWDAVYHSRVYAEPISLEHTGHDVMVGSYSKLLGINGIRVGWIAMDDEWLYNRMAKLVTAEYCGLSHPSSYILLELLNKFYWDQFEMNARYKLNYNREEWSKLEKYFEGHPVSPVGMFYYANMDKSCKKLMEKAGILYMSGTSLGTDDNHGRFNLGQDNKLIKNAVKSILKADKI